MRFLNLVEQHHRIGLASDRFGQLSPFIIAHISRRRTDQPGSAEFLLILAHIDTGHHIFVVKQVFGQCFRQFGLSHSRGTQKNERAHRPFRIAQPGTVTAYRIGHGSDGFILTDDTPMKLLFQMKQFLPLALHHLADRNTGPPRYHVGNIFGIDLLLDHRAPTLAFVQLLLQLFNLIFFLLDGSIAQLGYPAIIAFPFGALCLKLGIFNVDLILLYLIDNLLFGLPFGLVFRLFVAQVFDLLGKQFLLLRIIFTTYRFTFYLQLLDPTHDLIQLFGNGIDLHTQFGSRLVHQVDCLVG